jgi:hypothetical protein
MALSAYVAVRGQRKAGAHVATGAGVSTHGLRAAALAAVAATVTALTAGCVPDACDAGVRRCRHIVVDGHVEQVAESCVSVTDSELTSHTEWVVTPCGELACVTPPAGLGGLAFCATDGVPDPACPEALRTEAEASRCLGDTVVTWRFGYRVRDEPCGGGTSCVDVSRTGFDPGCAGTAFCSPLDGPDPLCGPGVATACADERTLVHCACGFRREAHACRSPGPSCRPLLPAAGGPAQAGCR